MEFNQKQRVLLLSVAAAVILICISCQTKTQPNDTKRVPAAYVDKCVVYLANPQDCPLLSFGNDERVVWINNTGADVYVCFDPHSDPFEAYAWYVTPGDKGKSGKIKDGVSYTTYDYYLSSTSCTVLNVTVKTNPKIKIGN
jgi:hypothetical protein